MEHTETKEETQIERFYRMQMLLGRNHVFQRYDLMTRSQILVIYTLLKIEREEQVAVTTSLLAKRLNVSNPAMSRRVNKLEELGWIERTTDPSDRRTQHLSVTAYGRKVFKQARRQTNAVMAEILADYSTEEIDRLIEMGTAIGKKMQTMNLSGEDFSDTPEQTNTLKGDESSRESFI